MAMPVEKSIAPPMPWKTRDTSMTAEDDASAESRDDSVKTTLPYRRRRRRP
jgi:hypothetical protein